MINRMARTTLFIDKQTLIALKRLAAAQRRTLSAVVDEFLSEGLRRTNSRRARRAAVRLPSFDMGRPMVNVADRDQLYEVLDRK
jgi:hypothetical protein